ncbi:hypothetical protein BX616_004913 [Lobosporangium transversale]|uniref:Uncharacterized protein n=1 Tax=Lobosporangium transversale TaxID=64571 RepID=A0A1Y2GFD9_9FUNG|nr:hypothetical protein BCR41DRAFT_358543 [Lobosporangium transversale]KAF9897832.1 hypothetical protein BX616_004913 [Lobosporangium transversale]ORZ09333.1 hypothetical protein BCR41DRAFT_358543 [Lobosporangium transversale]|eukprot:XP_021878786.1 hypothetical protein BCR41DRAFT_358543 [Lobosporangium transversale]
MASVIVFPNVTTHRKLPHLSRESKDPKVETKDTKISRENLPVLFDHNMDPLSARDHAPLTPPGPSSSSPGERSKGFVPSDASSLSLKSPSSVSLCNDISHTNGQNLLSNTAASESKSALTTTGHNQGSGDGFTMDDNFSKRGSIKISKPNSASAKNSAMATSPLSRRAIRAGLSDVNPATATPMPHPSILNSNSAATAAAPERGQRGVQGHEDAAVATVAQQINHDNNAHHQQQQQQQQQQLHPSDGPHGPNSSALSLPLSVSTTPPLEVLSSSLSPPESKTMRIALYDAFGCLYHPIQHTHHHASSSFSSSSSLSSMSSSTAMSYGRLSNASSSSTSSGVTVPSDETIPLIGISPRSSPMLRPHLGPSAPITPLDLYAEGHVGEGGYFGSKNGSMSSPPPNGLNRSGSSRHLYVHHSHNHHPHHHPYSYSHHLHQSMDSAKTLKSRGSSLDYNLNPTEHPVLCSLQMLSLTHPHPPEHYHPHLGHDLGHDRVSITSSSTLFEKQS